jgi:hypothetical protein
MWGDDAESAQLTIRSWIDLVNNESSHGTALEGFYKVLCADIIHQDPSQQNHRSSRRTVPEDEAVFVCWAHKSPMSPFGCPLTGLTSKYSRAWSGFFQRCGFKEHRPAWRRYEKTANFLEGRPPREYQEEEKNEEVPYIWSGPEWSEIEDVINQASCNAKRGVEIHDIWWRPLKYGNFCVDLNNLATVVVDRSIMAATLS